MTGDVKPHGTLTGSLGTNEGLRGTLTGTGIEGHLTVPSSIIGGNYNNLSNKPSIEDVELVGNRTFDDLGLTYLTNEDLMGLLT